MLVLARYQVGEDREVAVPCINLHSCALRSRCSHPSVETGYRWGVSSCWAEPAVWESSLMQYERPSSVDDGAGCYLRGGGSLKGIHNGASL